MKPFIDVHAVKVAGYAVYTCSKCSKMQRGDWYSVEMAGALPTKDELPTPTPHYIPVGWGHYGNGDYRCNEHTS